MPTRTPAHAQLLAALVLVVTACKRPPLRALASSGDAGSLDVPDALDAQRVTPPRALLCPVRSLPPAEIDDVQPRASDLVWTGTQWGVAWSEPVDAGEGVRFVRVDASGHAKPPSVLVSDVGYRGDVPRVLWSESRFWVAFEGGAALNSEVFLAQLDPLGTRVGAPVRQRARDRQDRDPFILPTDSGFLLSWSSEMTLDGNRVLFAQPLSHFGTAIAPPTWIDQRHTATRSPRWVNTPSGPAVVWLLTRADGEFLGVDLARYTPSLELRSAIQRVTPDTVGGPDDATRVAFAWDGESYFVLWDEVREGSTRVVLRRIGARGRLDPPVVLSPPNERASHPALVALAPNTLAVAWQVERRSGPRVRVLTIDGDGRALGEGIQVQDRDGVSSNAVLRAGDGALGVITQSPAGLRFHLAPLGPCDHMPAESSTPDAG